MKTYTRGNVIVEDIKVGDIHYQYELGVGIKSQVLTLPVKNDNECWSWKSKNLTSEKEIEYSIHEKYYQAAPELYDYEAYQVKIYI